MAGVLVLPLKDDGLRVQPCHFPIFSLSEENPERWVFHFLKISLIFVATVLVYNFFIIYLFIY